MVFFYQIRILNRNSGCFLISDLFHRSKHWHQSSQSVDTATDIEKSDMSELASCLPLI